MFGLDQINWTDFISLLICSLLIWYLSLFLFLFWKSRRKGKQNHFEEELGSSSSENPLQAIRVAANDFPSEIISAFAIEQRLGITSVYEEIASNDGYSLEELKNGKLPHYLKENQIATESVTQ